MHSPRPLPPGTPHAIGPANCEFAIGAPWRWVRDFARAHGVPMWRVGAKTVIPAAPLLAALEREAARTQPVELDDPETLAGARQALAEALR